MGWSPDIVRRFTNKLNRVRVHKFFQDLDALRVVTSELFSTSSILGTRKVPYPLVILARYRDNLYIVSGNVGTRQLPRVRAAVLALLSQVYGIRLKWEKHGARVVWGESSLAPCPKVGLNSMYHKGVALSLSDHQVDRMG